MDSLPITGGKPAYIGTVNIYINDQKAFDAAGAQHGKTLLVAVRGTQVLRVW
jgi:hypothetical protein